MSECTHVPALPRPEPEPLDETCPECVAAGTQPVHLRLCLVCGHVGCCDSSPLRHATGHFKETGHPVMRSFEPGESWRWCFVDAAIV
ncbi:UBP-type zinc finger domain-containing protein [Streptomyces sp. NPDC052042]|uniref:UBP-type zinc finger domain-containing protein n=1 Tax=Streptomyces sp. NPDC052042 TaxID=3365683 RepID=UPI0037D1BDC2